MILKPIQDYIIFLSQIIWNMNHKIFIANTSLRAKFIHSKLQLFRFKITHLDLSQLLPTYYCGSLNRDGAVCAAYLLISLTHTTLQFPLGNLKLLAFLTSSNATFPTVELALMEKIRCSFDDSFNSLNLTIFYQGPLSRNFFNSWCGFTTYH